DHPRLAEAALRHVHLRPGLLEGMRAIWGESLDGGDLHFRQDRGHRAHAAARGDAVDVHGATAALGYATAVLGAGQTELFPQHPQERRFALRLELTYRSIDVKRRHT